MSEPATPAGWATILAAILLPALVAAVITHAIGDAALEADARLRAGLQRQIDRQDRDIGGHGLDQHDAEGFAPGMGGHV